MVAWHATTTFANGSRPQPLRFLPPRRGRMNGSLSSIVSARLFIVGLSRSVLTISLKRMNIAAGSAPTGRFSPIRRIVQNDLDIAEYTDPAHNHMIPT